MKQQDQSNLSKYLLTQVILFLLIIFLLIACKNQISKNTDPHQTKNIIVTDSIKTTLDFYYFNFPDSAILLSEQLLLQTKKGLTAEDRLFLYSFLAELYQYRNKNDLLSLHNLTQVIRLLSEHPELSFDNPYLFVNFGNILLKYGLYKQALSIYREALQIPLFPDNHHIKILTSNNIALIYVELNRFDSARYYFQHAASYIPANNNILQAQNNAFLTTLYLENNRMDYVPFYYQKSVDALNKHKDYSLSQPKNNYRADVLYHEIWAHPCCIGPAHRCKRESLLWL